MVVGVAIMLARPAPAVAQGVDLPLLGISEVKLGALYHDVPGLWSGFSLERPAADVNFEVLLLPWAYTFGGSLRPALGTTVNYNGDTSKAYADLRWEIEAQSGLFFALGMGAAVHDGQLDAANPDRKALGSRVLFHPSAELGYRFDGVNSISIFADHMSNGFTERYNDGMDTLGIRFGHRLGPIVPEAPQDPPAVSYAGAYVGAFGNFQWETSDWYTAPGTSAERTAFAGGGFAGIGWQSGRGVVGLEVDFTPGRRDFAVGCSAGITCDTRINGLYALRPRFGWIVGSTLVYGTGGFALAPWDSRVLSSATSQQLGHAGGLNYGVAVGAGIEHKIAQSLAVRAEFMHYGIAGWEMQLPAGPAANQFQSTVGRVGISWYFH
jgi:opacity protein-like surface antigen